MQYKSIKYANLYHKYAKHFFFYNKFVPIVGNLIKYIKSLLKKLEYHYFYEIVFKKYYIIYTK